MGKLIVHADDYGINHDVNLAIEMGIQEKIINRATLMVNMPYAEEALEMAKRGGYLSKIGLHLNLVEGGPVTDKIKNTWLCTDGLINGRISDKKYKTGIINDKEVLECIEAEVNAQMKIFSDWNMPLMHVDSHQHSHIKPSIFPIVMKCAIKNGFVSMRLASLIPSDNPKGKVKIYKNIINIRIKTFNKHRWQPESNFPQIDMGCAFLSLKRQIDTDDGFALRNRNIEMWFHPSLVNGEIVNLYCKSPFSVTDILEMKKRIEG